MFRRVLFNLVIASVVMMVPPTGMGGALSTTGRYLVVLKDRVPGADAADLARRAGTTVDNFFASVHTMVVSLRASDVDRLRHDRRVAYVVPDEIVHLVGAGTLPPRPAVPTGVTRIGAAPLSSDGWFRTGAAGVRKAAVAVLDTGVMARPDLSVVGGHDCTGPAEGSVAAQGTEDGDGTTEDHNGHGTHVAGIIAGSGVGGEMGVSPGSPLYAVRVFGADAFGPLSNVVCGLDWVARHAAADNIKVVNLSLSDSGSDDGDCGRADGDPLHRAVCRVVAAGVTVVAAAGNDTENVAHSVPGAYGEVLAVTAMADFDGRPGGSGSPPAGCQTSNRDDTAADFSDYAVPGSPQAGHTIAAPGDCITADWNDGTTRMMSGTSMASPHVAGLVARCIDAGPCAGLKPARIVAKLLTDAAARPAGSGFDGDPSQPLDGRYYGYLATDAGY